MLKFTALVLLATTWLPQGENFDDEALGVHVLTIAHDSDDLFVRIMKREGCVTSRSSPPPSATRITTYNDGPTEIDLTEAGDRFVSCARAAGESFAFPRLCHFRH